MLTKNKIEMHDLVDLVITVLDARCPYTFSHSWRVAELSVMIAEDMDLDKCLIEKIHIAAHLHDIGKIGVSDRVLNKAGKLNRDELIEMQSHSRMGYNILNRLSLFREISDIVLYHHERYDGLGYPAGLKGESIPLGSRIIAVADTFDAITSDRRYRRGQSYDTGFEEINDHKGDQFCPVVVDHFMNTRNSVPVVLNKIERVSIEHIAFVGHEELVHSRRVI